MSTNEIDVLIREKRVYFVGEKLPSDWYEAVVQWMPLAEAGDAKAQYNIGRCYSNGDGVDKDKQQALAWYLKAAAQNEPRSHYNLHLYYEEKKDAAQAESWLEKAVALGEIRALYDLAYETFKKGNIDLARQQFQQATDAGSEKAQYGLVACNFEITGTSITKDTESYSTIVQGTSSASSYTTKYLTFTIKNGGPIATPIKLWTANYEDREMRQKIVGDVYNGKFDSYSSIEVGQSEDCQSLTTFSTLRKVFLVGIEVGGTVRTSAFTPKVDGVYFPLKPRLVWEKSGPCFVLTACYEDFDAPTVLQFRQFRDNHLTRYRLGKAFIAWYYTHGPKLAQSISDKPRTKAVFRRVFNSIAKLLP